MENERAVLEYVPKPELVVHVVLAKNCDSHVVFGVYSSIQEMRKVLDQFPDETFIISKETVR